MSHSFDKRAINFLPPYPKRYYQVLVSKMHHLLPKANTIISEKDGCFKTVEDPHHQQQQQHLISSSPMSPASDSSPTRPNPPRMAASGPEQQKRKVNKLLETKFAGNHMGLTTWGRGSVGRRSDMVFRVFTPSQQACFHGVKEGGGVKQAQRIRVF